MSNNNICLGYVVATDDPNQDGRVKVYVPSWDGNSYDVENLPWATYCSPFAGMTTDYPAGGTEASTESVISYGMWAVPKLGASVAVFLLDGDTSARCYFGGIVRPVSNRSLPRGRNYDGNNNHGPLSDLHDQQGNHSLVEPAFGHLVKQFNSDLNAPEAITRGAFEKAVAQSSKMSDGSDGYTTNPKDPSYLDSQTYCFTTPGRNSIIMQDDPRWCRIRLVTPSGQQLILDDTNERIYLSTNEGHSWLEMDSDGHIQLYGAESFSVRSGNDINFFADKNFNVEASAINLKATGGSISLHSSADTSIKANGAIIASGCRAVDISSEGVMRLNSVANLDLSSNAMAVLTAKSGVDLGGSGVLVLAGSTVQVKGSCRSAAQPSCPSATPSVSLLPTHEPWKRPVSKKKRNKNWRP